MTAARDRLGVAQAALVSALVLGGPTPSGFPADRIEATARTLLHKRAHGIAFRWPLLAHSLGEEFLSTVVGLLATVPPDGPLRDGWRMARALRETGRLPPGALGELLTVEATYRCRAGRVHRRHGITVRFGRCGRRTVVVLRTGSCVRRFG